MRTRNVRLRQAKRYERRLRNHGSVGYFGTVLVPKSVIRRTFDHEFRYFLPRRAPLHIPANFWR